MFIVLNRNSRIAAITLAVHYWTMTYESVLAFAIVLTHNRGAVDHRFRFVRVRCCLVNVECVGSVDSRRGFEAVGAKREYGGTVITYCRAACTE